MCCNGYTCTLQVYVSSVSAIPDGYCNCFIWMLQSRSGCSMCYNGFTCMLQIYVPNVSFVFKPVLQVFSSECCKTSSRGCKSTSAFQIPVCMCKTERAKPRARVERRVGWSHRARACNVAGGVARETE
jgi:hypothetical protein